MRNRRTPPCPLRAHRPSGRASRNRMAGWSAARRPAESPRERTPSVSLRFGYLYRKSVRIAEHVGAEHHPLLVRRETHIRLQPVVVLRHIDQLLRAKHAGLHEILLRSEEHTSELQSRQYLVC